MDSRKTFDLGLPLVMLAAVLMITIGCLVWKEVFWDDFVWKYYWAPIVSDAGGDSGGITPSYNWIDTISYGIVLAASAYYIHKLFVKLKLRVGFRFFLAMSPILLIGPSARVLEDMELFNEPLQYVFISPIIYIFLGITTLLTILLFYRLESKYPKGGKWFDRGTFLLLLIPGIAVLTVILVFPDQLNESIPLIPILAGTPLAAYLYTRFRRSTRWEGGVGFFWFECLLLVIYMYILWIMKGAWYDHFVSIKGVRPETELSGALLILVLVLAVTGLVWVIIHLLSRRYESLKKMKGPINTMIIGGHMLDASATFIGIDRYGYVEKHILPSTLMEWTGTAAVMYPLKLIFLLPALYIMDVGMEEESRENPHLMALVKLTVLILGFAPGSRDIIRLALGV